MGFFVQICLHILKYLIELKEQHGYSQIDPAADRNIAFIKAAKYGHLHILRYLMDLKENYGYKINPTTKNNQALQHPCKRPCRRDCTIVPQYLQQKDCNNK